MLTADVQGLLSRPMTKEAMRPAVPIVVRVLGTALVVLIVAFGVHALTRFGGEGWDGFFLQRVYQAVQVIALVIVVARVVLAPAQRGAFALIALGMLMSLGGDFLWDHIYAHSEGAVPVPSVADVLYVATYVPYGSPSGG